MSSNLEADVVALCRAARAAAPDLARASTDEKNAALHAGASALRTRNWLCTHAPGLRHELTRRGRLDG